MGHPNRVAFLLPARHLDVENSLKYGNIVKEFYPAKGLIFILEKFRMYSHHKKIVSHELEKRLHTGY